MRECNVGMIFAQDSFKLSEAFRTLIRRHVDNFHRFCDCMSLVLKSQTQLVTAMAYDQWNRRS